jgi:hypothetical protein
MEIDECMNGTGTRLGEEINEALRLHGRFGATCLSDPGLSGFLEKLRSLIGRTDSAMLRSGVVEACARCAASGKGSCCFKEMGESFGFMELFINLLLGSDLPDRTGVPGSCRFLGKDGCKLKARQSFCLNYFCPDLKDSLGAETILWIQRQVGEQLQAEWELERALARHLSETARQEQI